MFLNDPFGLNKEPSPTSIKKHKQPSKPVTVRHIFHSLSAKYFVLTARNISRWKRTFETQQITSFHLHPKKLHTYTSPTLHNTHTKPSHHPPPPYSINPSNAKESLSPTLSNRPDNTIESPSPTLFNKPLQRKRITLLYPTTFCLHNYIPLTYSPPPSSPSQLTSPYFHSNTINTFTTTFP